MNDFTKEELQDIYDAVMDTSVAMFEHLPAKIQSLIDNYCEIAYPRKNMTRDEFQKMYPDVSDVDGSIIIEKYGDNLK